MQEDKKIIMSVKPELPYAIEEAINRLRINVKSIRRICGGAGLDEHR